ncbi:MAG: hypothetical protein E7434_03315 [Ruminococcaceae bacterium]|nr:hypothetical protein [Oscillospiraceae bacterium]
MRRETAYETARETIVALVSASISGAFFGYFLGKTRKYRSTQWSKPKHCLHFCFRRKFLKITKYFTARASRMHPKSTSSLRSERRALRRDTKLTDKSEFGEYTQAAFEN